MKTILKFKDYGSKLTGISTPFGGVSWQPSQTERAVAASVVTFLEDRRVLYKVEEAEVPDHCIASVIEIRHFLSGKLSDLDPKNELAKNLSMMRSSCRKFMDKTQELQIGKILRPNDYNSWFFCAALGEMRGVFGFCLAQIVLAFGLDIEKELASILPSSQ